MYHIVTLIWAGGLWISRPFKDIMVLEHDIRPADEKLCCCSRVVHEDVVMGEGALFSALRVRCGSCPSPADAKWVASSSFAAPGPCRHGGSPEPPSQLNTTLQIPNKVVLSPSNCPTCRGERPEENTSRRFVSLDSHVLCLEGWFY